MAGAAIKSFTDRNGVKHNIQGTGGGGASEAEIQELQAIVATKADMVSGSVDGHLAQFDENGNLEDGGEKSQFAAANHTHDGVLAADARKGSASIKTKLRDLSLSEGAGGEIEIALLDNGSTTQTATIKASNIANLKRALQDPAAPASGEDKLITNGQVYTALAAKQNTLTFDSKPTALSSNPVTSGGIYSALTRTISIKKVDSAYEFEDSTPNLLAVKSIVAELVSDNSSKIREVKIKCYNGSTEQFITWGSLKVTVGSTVGTVRNLGISIYADGYVLSSSATIDENDTITLLSTPWLVVENSFFTGGILTPINLSPSES